jgi:WD40 repeat protein
MEEVLGLAFTRDGEGLLVAGHETWGWAAGRVLLVRLSDYQGVSLHTGAGHGLAVSPNGAALASGADDRTVHVWPAPGEIAPEGALPGHRQETRALAFTRDGRVLVSAAAGELKRWDMVTGKELPAVPSPPADAVPLALSAGAALLATGGEDGVVRVWETATGREVAAFDWGFGPVYAAAFAPDGMTAAAAGRDFRVVVWDVDDLGA